MCTRIMFKIGTTALGINYLSFRSIRVSTKNHTKICNITQVGFCEARPKDIDMQLNPLLSLSEHLILTWLAFSISYLLVLQIIHAHTQNVFYGFIYLLHQFSYYFRVFYVNLKRFTYKLNMHYIMVIIKINIVFHKAEKYKTLRSSKFNNCYILLEAGANNNVLK